MEPEAWVGSWQRNTANEAQISSPWLGEAPEKQNQSLGVRTRNHFILRSVELSFHSILYLSQQPPCLLFPAGFCSTVYWFSGVSWAPEHMLICSLLCFHWLASPGVSWSIFQTPQLCRTTDHLSRALMTYPEPWQPFVSSAPNICWRIQNWLGLPLTIKTDYSCLAQTQGCFTYITGAPEGVSV